MIHKGRLFGQASIFQAHAAPRSLLQLLSLLILNPVYQKKYTPAPEVLFQCWFNLLSAWPTSPIISSLDLVSPCPDPDGP